jgi:Abortive infection C-terminus
MLSEEVVSAVARFFEGGRGPSHDELSRLFRRFGLEGADPQLRFPGEQIGKMKRVREVLSAAIDTDAPAAEQLIGGIVGSVKARGGFRSTSGNYAGEDLIQAAREAFRAQGYDLDPAGDLRPLLLNDLSGVAATEALAAYVRRAHAGSSDAALVLGTGKDLLEATARHVLVTKTGVYPPEGNFPATLYQAFDRLQLALPSQATIASLEQDARAALQQALWLLAVAANRFRSEEGIGHGRPLPASVTEEEARLSIQAMALVSQLLLDTLNT